MDGKNRHDRKRDEANELEDLIEEIHNESDKPVEHTRPGRRGKSRFQWKSLTLGLLLGSWFGGGNGND